MTAGTSLGGDRDPFLALDLPYDAGPDDVRRAFRRLARRTHPDRGGSAGAFHEIRAAYGSLTADLEGERRRWRPPPAVTPRARYAAGLSPQAYPTCPVRVGRTRDGRRRLTYETGARPTAWKPGVEPPPGGVCEAHYAATDGAPAFGVWTVPLDAHHFRCVFGPQPPGS